MRRKDREISSKEEIIKIIQKEGICRLAIKDDLYPYIVPMNYGIDHQQSWSITHAPIRIRNLCNLQCPLCI